jgi:hypothetical protein
MAIRAAGYRSPAAASAGIVVSIAVRSSSVSSTWAASTAWVVLAGVGLAGVLVLPTNGADEAGVVESGSVERADVDLVPFRHPQGAYELSVPEGWVSMSFDGDVSEVGERAFPDDPELAEEFQDVANARPASLRFMSVDPDETTPRELGDC